MRRACSWMALTLCGCANILGFEEGKPLGSGSGGAAGANGTASSSVGQGGGTSAYVDAVMQDGPCGYWRLGEAMPPVAVDASGNGADGTYLGGVTLGAPGALAGDTDTAATFDGVSGTKLEIEGDTFHFPVKEAFTIEIWVKPPALAGGYPTVIGKFEDVGSVMNGWWIYAKSSSTEFLRDNGMASSAVTGPALALGVFTHIVASYDGTSMRLYLNGGLIQQEASSLEIGAHQLPLVVGGRYTADAPFAATIDEVAIYCKALEPADVLEHYSAATTR